MTPRYLDTYFVSSYSKHTWVITAQYIHFSIFDKVRENDQ